MSVLEIQGMWMHHTFLAFVSSGDRKTWPEQRAEEEHVQSPGLEGASRTPGFQETGDYCVQS